MVMHGERIIDRTKRLDGLTVSAYYSSSGFLLDVNVENHLTMRFEKFDVDIIIGGEQSNGVAQML